MNRLVQALDQLVGSQWKLFEGSRTLESKIVLEESEAELGDDTLATRAVSLLYAADVT